MSQSKKPFLSILICTMPSRNQEFQLLLGNLKNQISKGFDSEVELIYNDRMDVTTGFKRNFLLQESRGQFVVFIDDDDEVSHQYVSLIVNTIKKNPKVDCIGISGTISFAGENSRQWHISKDYGRWYEKNNIYYRTPNHISPIKREIALNAGFQNISISEDFAYSMAVLPMLKKEVKIESNLYHYKYHQKIQSNQNTDGGVYRPAWR